MSDPLLAPDEGENLCGRIKHDAKAAPVPFGHRLPEYQKPLVGGIPMIPRICDRLGHPLHNMRRRGKVRVADPQIDDIQSPGDRFLLQTIDFCKEVRGEL